MTWFRRTRRTGLSFIANEFRRCTRLLHPPPKKKRTNKWLETGGAGEVNQLSGRPCTPFPWRFAGFCSSTSAVLHTCPIDVFNSLTFPTETSFPQNEACSLTGMTLPHKLMRIHFIASQSMKGMSSPSLATFMGHFMDQIFCDL